MLLEVTQLQNLCAIPCGFVCETLWGLQRTTDFLQFFEADGFLKHLEVDSQDWSSAKTWNNSVSSRPFLHIEIHSPH